MPVNPKRGEVWRAKLDPTVGSEVQKTRPVVVVSTDALNKLPVRLVVPITEWKEHRAGMFHVELRPDGINGLDKRSHADVLQTRCLAVERFADQLGRISANLLSEIVVAIGNVIEAQ